MRRVGLLLLPSVLGCAPPDAFEIPMEPAIEILYPPDGVDIPLDGVGGTLAFTLVVDVDNLMLVDPDTTEGNVAGEGHYHVYVNNRYEGPVHDSYYDYRSNPGEFGVGTPMSVRVSLASNTHGDLNQYDLWQDIIEFDVASPLVR